MMAPHSTGVVVAAPETFGRDGAMFESLLGFVAELSLVVWSLVALTLCLRFIGVRVYRRGAAHPARSVGGAAVTTPAPDAASEQVAGVRAGSGLVHLGLLDTSTTDTRTGSGGAQQPVSVNATAVMQAQRHRRPDHAYAANYTEA